MNRALPEDMRDTDRVLDKKGLHNLLREVAQKHPDKYRDVVYELTRIGRDVAYTTGGYSFGPEDMRQLPSAKLERKRLHQQINKLLDDDSLTDEEREEKMLLAIGKVAEGQQDRIFKEALENDNPLAYQVLSGSRGSPMTLARLLGSDLLYTDHRDRVIPVPIMHSYSQGLRPIEYWAGAYGARKGVLDTKFSTQDAGYLSKQLNQIVHRSLVTALDRDNPPDTLRGLPVDTTDEESEGSLLAHDIGGYRRNTVITPKILQDLRNKGIDRILVRSPAVGGAPDGGVYGRDAGVREFGRLPLVGENVGMTAAQALAEPLSQAQLSSKHAGGVAGATASTAVSGFDRINQLIQTPKSFKGGAAHAEVDGLVQRVEDAPAGGKYVTIENKKHYVGEGFNVKVKPGEEVEAGDAISDGFPNPSIIVAHKGVGAGRRYFIKLFREAFWEAGLEGHRRNIELLARGLINHVRIRNETNGYLPDDVVPYSMIEADYEPRGGFQSMPPQEALGKYLERPYLHYTIGTKVRPSMIQDFEQFGVDKLDVHDDEPPFEPEMIRGAANLQHDPDWITKMFGSGLRSSVLKATHRGSVSDTRGTSFVPGLARGVDFGREGKVVTPQLPNGKMQARENGIKISSLAKQARQLKEAQQEEAARFDSALRHMLRESLARDRLLRQSWDAYQKAQQEYAESPRGTLDNIMSWGHGAFNIGEGDVQHPGYVDSLGRHYPGEAFLDRDRQFRPGPLAVPAGSPEERSQFFLPEQGARGDDLAAIQAYNEAVKTQAPLDQAQLVAAHNAMKRMYPHLYRRQYHDVYTPEARWQLTGPEEREAGLRDLYSQRYPDQRPVRSFSEMAQSPSPPPEYLHLQGQQVDQPVAYDPNYMDKVLNTLHSDPEFQQNLSSLPRDAQVEMMKKYHVLADQYSKGQLTKDQLNEGIKQVAATAFAVEPGTAAETLRNLSFTQPQSRTQQPGAVSRAPAALPPRRDVSPAQQPVQPKPQPQQAPAPVAPQPAAQPAPVKKPTGPVRKAPATLPTRPGTPTAPAHISGTPAPKPKAPKPVKKPMPFGGA